MNFNKKKKKKNCEVITVRRGFVVAILGKISLEEENIMCTYQEAN